MSEFGRNINLTPAICTQCGAALEVDPKQEAAICKYCKTPFIVEKAINNYNVQQMAVKHVDSINIVKPSAIDSVLKFADKQINRRAEEKRRVEEEARIEKEKNDAHFRKYWWVYIAAIAAMFLILNILGAQEAKASAGKIALGIPASELSKKNYEEVVAKFAKAGFTNVNTETIDDLIVGWLTKDGEVEKVSIDGDTEFSANAKYLPNAKVLISYHTFPAKKAETSKAIETTKASELAKASETTKANATTKGTTGVPGLTLDLNAINNTNSAKADTQFVGKVYRVTGIVDQAIKGSEGNALILVQPKVMAKGMGSTIPLEINIWLTAEEFAQIGGTSSAGKQIDISKKLTSISRNTISTDPKVLGYPVQLEFGVPY